MVSAGEALNPEVIGAFREATGLEIADGYGQTETGAVTGMRPGEAVAGREGSMGRPLPGIETRIVEGELQVMAATSPPSSTATSTEAASKASGGRPATWSARTMRVISFTKAGTMT